MNLTDDERREILARVNARIAALPPISQRLCRQMRDEMLLKARIMPEVVILALSSAGTTLSKMLNENGEIEAPNKPLGKNLKQGK